VAAQAGRERQEHDGEDDEGDCDVMSGRLVQTHPVGAVDDE
jgi:hypothetical protein